MEYACLLNTKLTDDSNTKAHKWQNWLQQFVIFLISLSSSVKKNNRFGHTGMFISPTRLFSQWSGNETNNYVMLPFAVKVMFRAAFLYGSAADGDVFIVYLVWFTYFWQIRW